MAFPDAGGGPDDHPDDHADEGDEAGDLESILAALADPRAWAGAHRDGRPLERIETHGAVLLLGPERVLKIRKAVDLGFLDFSTLERRRRFSAEECRLNRRLAAWMDHRVRAIVRTGDPPGVALREAAADGPVPPGTVEWAVEMRRLPADGMLDRRLAEGRVEADLVERLAAVLADFHRDAARSGEIDRWSRADAVAASHERNLEQCGSFVGDRLPAAPGATDADADEPPVTLERAVRDRMRTWMRAEAERLGPRIDRRVEAGRACEGHGDLHAGNVCLVPDADAPDGERIVIYDAIEFDPRLRSHDVAEDLAFLGMDLDRRGHPDLADALIDAYAEAAPGESAQDLRDLQPMLRAHFALVRGKVTSIRASELAGDERADAARDAERAFLHAAGYAIGRAAVTFCGLPGTGKTTVADLLRGLLRGAAFASDRIRKELAGVAPDEPAGPDAYTAEMSDRTYAALRTRGAEALARGTSVVMDANHPVRARRRYLAAWAGSQPVLLVHLDAPLEVLEARLEERQRARGRRDASDADADVLHRVAERFEPPGEDEGVPVLRIPADLRPERIVSAIIARLLDA